MIAYLAGYAMGTAAIVIPALVSVAVGRNFERRVAYSLQEERARGLDAMRTM